MQLRLIVAALVAGAACIAVVEPTEAQIRPATSGDTSYYEPEMRRHGSGLHHPREAHVHRRHWHRHWRRHRF